VVMFWSLEAAYAATIQRRQEQIRKAEKVLLGHNDEQTNDLIFLYPFSYDEKVKLRTKIKNLYEAFLHEETLSYLYLLLIGFSVLYPWILQ
jgi:hypothetical protein